MIDSASLRLRIPQFRSRPFRHTLFRAMQLRHHADPLGRGRPIRRQRFNIDHGSRILYLGDDQITSLFEVQAFGFPATSIAIVPLEVQLNAVLDLRDASLRAALGISQADVEFNFRSLPHGSPPTDIQNLGEALAASNSVDGLFYESVARPGSVCLAVLEAGVSAVGSIVEVNDAQNKLRDRLHKPLASGGFFLCVAYPASLSTSAQYRSRRRSSVGFQRTI